MKAKSILAAALVLISSATFANESDNNFVVIRGQESGIFKVIFEGKDQVKATVKVLDKTGKLVYSTNIQGKNGFILPMNFTELKPGAYTIEVTSGSNTWTQVIQYTTHVAKNSSVEAAKVSSIQYVHVAKMEENGKYLLSIAKTGVEAVTINIFDAQDELLHAETRKTDGDLAVVYDIKELLGAMKFQITDKSGYSKVIKK